MCGELSSPSSLFRSPAAAAGPPPAPLARRRRPPAPQPPAKARPDPRADGAPTLVGLRTDEEFDAFVAGAAGGAAIVQFGSSWCQKCVDVFPHFYRLSKAYPATRFGLAQVDYMRTAAAGVRYSPTFAFYRGGRRVDALVGAGGQRLADRVWLHAD